MANNVKNATNFSKFNERRGLYRVWVPLHDDGKAPLISIWIDPDLRAFEFCTEEENPAGARTQVSSYPERRIRNLRGFGRWGFRFLTGI